MSEPLPGVDVPLPPAKVRDAAAVVLVRGDTQAHQEVFWVRRGEQLRFSGGFYAFPGGKLDREDASLPIEGAPRGEEAIRACALRETFEEAGVLLARGGHGLPQERLDAVRRELLGGASFGALLARERLVLDGAALLPAGRWVTPPFSPVRFDARFFVARVGPDVEASVIPGELTAGGFIRPAEALRRWEEGQVLLHPPNHHALATLAGFAAEAAIPRLRAPPFLGDDFVVRRIEFQRGIHLLPLRTPTLPPAQHTNCWIVGTGELALVDPGSPWAEEQAALEAHLDELAAEGRTPKVVLLTHHHGDHVGGALALARKRGIPVWSSAATAARVPGAEGRLKDGSLVVLDGPRPMTLRAILAGDMVAGGSTIVIDPPEGDMGVYLESLERLLARGPGTLYPAHGYPIPDGAAKLREYLAHREARLAQLLAALEGGPAEVPALVERVYEDTPPFLHPVAERSALASLLLLARRGQVQEEGGRWRRR